MNDTRSHRPSIIAAIKISKPHRFHWLMSLALYGLLLCALAPVLSMDVWRVGMFLTYPPRILLLPFALLCILYFIWAKKNSNITLSVVTGLLLLLQSGCNPLSQKIEDPRALTLLSFNIHNAVANVDELQKLCREKNIDILSFQEIQPQSREAFILGLSNYQFYWADESKKFEHANSGPFSSLIGVKKSLIESSSTGQNTVEIETAITQYRTFAARIALRRREFYLVNVHTTKALWLRGSMSEIISRMDYKSAWHVGEMNDLRAWIKDKQQTHRLPIILAGDFNAPDYSYNLKFSGFANAHRTVGNGLHLTFPAALPVFSLDHIFASEQVELVSYRTLKTPYSDHYAQLLRFKLPEY
jgi:endonuclease/exonuclease/phosphatase (EEP) superfamily protein YafD